MRHFDARLTLEVAESTVQQAMVVVKDGHSMAQHGTACRDLREKIHRSNFPPEELSRLGWLPPFDSEALSLQATGCCRIL